MPHDPHLADLMRQAFAGRRDIVEKKMFGGYCWMLNGNMLCGVEIGRFMFRVGKELEAEALARRPRDGRHRQTDARLRLGRRRCGDRSGPRRVDRLCVALRRFVAAEVGLRSCWRLFFFGV
ncbi:MAG: TfoX/Sxy family protein [Rhizobacter sp.]|nr:TfoX/Sxy family protein [Rhizobacter sp.]